MSNLRTLFAGVGVVAIFVATSALLCNCNGKGTSQTNQTDSVNHNWPDTLRVATLYSPTSYFVYRDVEMGYDYTLVQRLAKEKNIVVKLEIAPALSAGIQMLDSGLVDLVAYEVPVTSEYKQTLEFCGPEITTDQVLVQPRSDSLITDVTQLLGHTVYVERGSKYEQRMHNLNAELGGGVDIRTVNRDTLITEDLLEMVARNKIPLTVVDSHIARLNQTYYPTLDISLKLSFGQKSRWAVSKNNKWLADSINQWFGAEIPSREVDAVTKRYFQLSKNIPSFHTYDLSKGRISAYDHLFRKYATSLGWDWRLLAAVGFVESRFDNTVTSWAGAMGIMQVMPSTARANGYAPAALRDPETSIKVAVKILASLDDMFSAYVPDKKARQLFVLAGYNAGGAHILDAIALAKKYGKNSRVWDENVEQALLMKADPAYYNDPVCRYGYFRGRQTVEYVRQVKNFYARCQKQIKP